MLADRSVRLPIHICIGLTFGFLAIAINIALYGWSIELAGDQSTQIVAAETFLTSGDWLVPLHHSQTNDRVLTVGEDYRHRIFWFPPGYSALIASVSCFGFTTSSATLIIYLTNLVLSVALWIAYLRNVQVPFVLAITVSMLPAIFFRPSTTTDQLMWPLVICLMILSSQPRSIRNRLFVAALCILGLSLRWFAITFPFIWLAWSVVSIISERQHVKTITTTLVCDVGLVLTPTIAFLLWLSFYCSGQISLSPHPGSYISATRWYKLASGIYYAIGGGWSPGQSCAKLLWATSVILGIVGIWLAFVRNNLPAWIKKVVIFQFAVLVFLIVVQQRKGSLFDPNVPAFATARYYILLLPVSVAAIAFGIEQLLDQNKHKRFLNNLNIVTSLLLIVLSLTTVNANWARLDEMKSDLRGFVRTADLAALERFLSSVRPDAIVNDSGDPLVDSLYDSRCIYPANVKLVSDVPRKIMIVKKLDSKDKHTTPESEFRQGEYEAIVYELGETEIVSALGSKRKKTVNE